MQSFKYPCIYLGDSASFPNKIQEDLILIDTFFIQTYKVPRDGEEVTVEAELYAQLEGKEHGANMYVIFFNCTSYMFSFEILEEALDCIQDFKDNDVSAILDELDGVRFKRIEKLQQIPFLKVTA